MRKARMLVPVAVCLGVLLMSVCALAADEMYFSEKSISLFEGDSYALTLTVDDALKEGTVRYKSSAPKVVSVDDRGGLTALSKGSASITASIKSAKKTYQAVIRVNVLRRVESVSLNERNLELLTEEDGRIFNIAQQVFSDFLPEDQYDAAMELKQILLFREGKNTIVQTQALPAAANDRSCVIVSSDETILSVKKLTLSALENGAAFLTVQSVQNPEITLTYGALVIRPVTGLSVDTLKTTIAVGQTSQLEVTYTPQDATLRNVKWTSETPKVATVDDYGLVTGLACGTAVIKATAQDGSDKTDSVRISVELLPSSVTIGGDSAISLATGKYRVLRATVAPSNASNKKVTWSSTDETVARVNQEGRVTAVKVGECDIICAAQADSDVFGAVHVAVVQEITGMKFEDRTLELPVGESGYAALDIQPADATNKTVRYTSDNERVAQVDESGLIQAIAKGETVIRARAQDGSGKAASLTVTVVQLPEQITMDKSSVVVNTGRSVTLRETVLPKNANNKNVTWESSDPSVATVNARGQVTGVKAGECAIICRAKANEQVTAVTQVSVHQLVTGITPSVKNLSVMIHEYGYISHTVSPADVTDPSVTYKSSKESIATVTQNGQVYGVKGGEATITISANDGSGKRATVRVTVIQPVEGVYMQEETAVVDVDDTVRLTAVIVPSNATDKSMTWSSMDSRIATVSGTSNRPTVTGRHWGTTEIRGFTQDGGFPVSAFVTVGDYNTAVRAEEIYLDNNQIKLVLRNVSTLNIQRAEFTIECFDIYDQPLACNLNGANYFDGVYQYPLAEDEETRHGRFNFIDFVQPYEQIGRVVVTVTSYRTQEGLRFDIPYDRQKPLEYKSSAYIGYLPEPEPDPEPVEPVYEVREDDTTDPQAGQPVG